MNPTPRWFWPVALVPIANALGLVALFNYDHTHPVEVADWATIDNVGMALALYVGFVLLLYLLFLFRRGPSRVRPAKAASEPEKQLR